jgi:hypothetical protein
MALPLEVNCSASAGNILGDGVMMMNMLVDDRFCRRGTQKVLVGIDISLPACRTVLSDNLYSECGCGLGMWVH